jgi:hypothetical protein
MSARLAAALVLVSAGALGACGGGDETGPERPPYPVSEQTMASRAEIEAFVPSLADEPARVAAALQDAATASAIRSHVTRLAGFLTARDAQAAAHEVTLGRETVAGYGSTVSNGAAIRAADAPELGVVEIVLDRAAQMIGLPPLASRATP